MWLYPVGWFTAPSKTYELFAGGARRYDELSMQAQTSPPDFDEMVHVDGKQVVWSAGHGSTQRIYKSYRQVLSAKQALLATFVGVGVTQDVRSLGVTGDSQVGDQQPAQSNFGGSTGVGANADAADATPPSSESTPRTIENLAQEDRCLCVLQGLECVKIYAPDGSEFEVALPCKAARMWALPRGILIERAVPGVDDLEDPDTPPADPIDPAMGHTHRHRPAPTQCEDDVPLPMFFSLLHPLEELKPVSYTMSQDCAASARELAGAEDGTTFMDTGTMHESKRDAERMAPHRLSMPSPMNVDEEADAFTPVRSRAARKPASRSQLQSESGDNDDDNVDDAPQRPQSASDLIVGEFMCDTHQRILFVDNSLCLVVTYHAARRTHAVWSLLPASAVSSQSNVSGQEGAVQQRMARVHEDDEEEGRRANAMEEEEESPVIVEAKGSSGKKSRSSRRRDGAHQDEVGAEGEDEDDEDYVAVSDASDDESYVDEDDLIESEVYMQEIWSGDKMGNACEPARSVFVAHDVNGNPLICLMHASSDQLQVLGVRTVNKGPPAGGSGVAASPSPMTPAPTALLATPVPSLMKTAPRTRVCVEHAFFLSCKSAQPVQASGNANCLDLLVLDLMGGLKLFRGGTELCSVELAKELVPPTPTLASGQGAIARRRAAAASSAQQQRPRGSPQVVRLERAVSNRVNLVLDNGLILRVMTAMAFSSRLVRPCLEGLDRALPARVALRIRVETAYWYDLLCNGSQDPELERVSSLLVGEEGLARTGKTVDLEWAAFVIVVAKLIQESLPEDARRSAAPASHSGPAAEDPGSAFARMMATDFHREYAQEAQGILPFDEVPAPKNHETHALWFEPLLQGSSTFAKSAMAPPEPFARYARVLLLCLHLVYEDMKLSTLTWSMSRPVAGLLSGIVNATLDSGSAARYADHYARDLGVQEPIPLPALPADARLSLHTTSSAPDVLDWLTLRAQRASGSYRAIKPAGVAFGGSTAGSFTESSTRAERAGPPVRPGMDATLSSGAEMAALRPFPELESCFRTQQLCCFFDLLAGGTGDEATTEPLEFRLSQDRKMPRAASKSPVMSAIVAMDGSLAHWMRVHGYEARNAAERTVLGMVWFNFTLQDLETLSFGLSIPLREALHFCRSNPSGSWPADAYVLVGREDMAALALAPTPTLIPVFMRKQLRQIAERLEAAAADADDVSPSLPPLSVDPPVFRTPAGPAAAKKSATSGASGTRSVSTPYVGSIRSAGSAFRRSSKLRRRRRLSEASLSTVTTAVTPVWRRVASGQGLVTQVAEDILWGGSAAMQRRTGGEGAEGQSLLRQQQQQRSQVTNATRKLLSIADFARLSASASAEVSAGSHGADIFGFEDENNPDATAGSGPGAGAGGAGATGMGDAHGSSGRAANANKSDDPSGFGLLQRMSSLRFGSDRRILEVCKLLRSSKPVRLAVERKPETSDHELVAEQQAKLLLLSRRIMALPVGRGMTTLGTVRPLLTDTVDIPVLALAGKIPPNNAVVKLDFTHVSNVQELMSWPQFHNGCAAGLRLAAGRQVTPLTRTWIAYNRPETPNATHAGYLMALGLHGHLAALTMADIYEYLAQGHDETTVAILLGLSAAKRGTMAPTVSKMLCLHIPSLLPAAFSDMEVPPTVQTSALLGIGLLYQATAHRLMTEFLLAEIGRRPSSDRCEDRESYSLAAGLALGFVTLGFGAREGGLSGLADLGLEDRLHRYMVGGLDPEYAAAQKAGNGVDPSKCSRVNEGPYVNVNVTSPGATLALAMMYLKSGNESVAARLAIPETHFLLDYVRPDLLMLRVVARSLVLWDTVEPTEAWALGQVPPAIRFSFERLLGGGSTAASIRAAGLAGARHAPEDEDDNDDYEMVSSAAENSGAEDDDAARGGAEEDDDDAQLRPGEDDDGFLPAPPARRSGTPGATPSPGAARRFNRPRSQSHDAVGSRRLFSNPIARLRRRGNSMISVKSRKSSVDEDSDGKPRRSTGVPVDEDAVRLAHANIVAGACFALGLRFVGTGLRAAQQTILRFVRHFAHLRTCESDDPRVPQRPDRSTLEMCLGICAISLALVMSGTGDLETLRVLRSLRFKVDQTVRFGNHMGIGAAIGILFLGGGRMSFSNDNASIAALLTAFYPRFPLHTFDNQYHLQALRHLYVLAAEERCLDAYDIDTRSPCYLPIKVTLREDAAQYYNDQVAPRSAAGVSEQATRALQSQETVVDMVAPCLLPPLAWISSIRVASPRYWPMDIALDGEKNVAQKLAISAYRVICVKRKVGHLSYLEDPQGVSSLLARPRLKLMQSKSGLDTHSSDFMRAFTADPHVLAFAKQFCSAAPPDAGDREQEFVEFCTATLYDCLTHEKPEMLNDMINLHQTGRAFERSSHSFHLRNLKVLLAFYADEGMRKLAQAAKPEEQPLVDYAFLVSLESKFRAAFRAFDAAPELLREYLQSLRFPSRTALVDKIEAHSSAANCEVLFATYLHFYGIPDASVLASMDLSRLSIETLPVFMAQHAATLRPHALLKMAASMATH